MSKVIVIFGATGNQGGSVITSILGDSSLSSAFRLRAVTRDTSKPAAQALAAKGVEVVAADLNDEAAVHKAVEGAYGVFAVTSFWESMSGDVEFKQGKAMVDAAKAAGAQHLVISVLDSPTDRELTIVQHFESKAKIASYARSSGVPTTYFLPGFYASNFPGGMIRKDDQSGGIYTLALPAQPDAQIPVLDSAADTGKYVKAIFKYRDSKNLIGKKIYAAVKYYTPLEIVEGFEKVFPKDGKGAKYVTLPADLYQSILEGSGMPSNAAEDLKGNVLLLDRKWGYYGGQDLEESNSILDEPATTWEQFLKSAPAYKDLQ